MCGCVCVCVCVCECTLHGYARSIENANVKEDQHDGYNETSILKYFFMLIKISTI
jgi:hypothetical protein